MTGNLIIDFGLNKTDECIKMKRTLLESQSTVDAVSFVGYVRDCHGIYIPIGVIYPLLACHSEINVMASLSMHHLTFQ